jgi:hypothetical protein
MIGRLIRNNLRKYYGKTLLIVVVLSISIVATIILRWLYANIQSFLMQQSWLYEYESVLEIKEKWGRWWLIGTKKISDTEQDFSVLLTDPDIQDVYVVSNVNLPVQARINIAGQTIGTDIIVFAISDSFFSWVNSSQWFPIAISEFMINVYNTQLADETTLPRISKSLIGLAQVELDFWASGIFDIPWSSVLRVGRIAKVSGMLPIGFVVPESVARSAIQELRQWTINPYKTIAVVDDPSKIPIITDRYKKDFIVISSYDKTKQIQDRIAWVKMFFLIINCSIVLILVSFLIYTTFSIVEQNQRSFRVFRVHGATPQTILLTLVGQVTAYSSLASILGLSIVYSSSIVVIPMINSLFVDTYGLQYLIQYPTLAVYSMAIWAHILLFAVLISIFSFPEWSKKFENN